MTSTERIQAAFKHQSVDRTPMFEYVLLSPIADILLGRPYLGDPDTFAKAVGALGWRQAVEQSAQDILDLAVKLDHDMIYVCPNPPRKGFKHGGYIATNNDILNDPVETIKKTNDVAQQNLARTEDERLLIYELLQKQMQRRSLNLPVMAPAYRHGIWTNTALMQTMLLAPEVAHEHFHLATQLAQKSIDEYFQRNVSIIGIGGDFAGNTLLISPAAYREFIVPELKILSDYIRQRGAWSVNASDGNLWPVIDDFLIGCRVDGYLEIDHQAGMNLHMLKERYGAEITLFGNIDCGTILTFGSKEEIKNHVTTCLDDGWGDGGHVFCASNAIASGVPLENYLTMLNAYREYFKLDRFQI
ncbi:MAG: hypothetical protein JW709_07190 [Sedimentisphaerales bacterium]|nr:hypothetical protein [Sedimentisphaerales bacterium]